MEDNIPSYYSHWRSELIPLFNQDFERVLEVGCGTGRLGSFLKKEKIAKKVYGIELNPLATQEARKVLDQVVCCNLNIVALGKAVADLEVNSFDCAVCADILEHLVDPWKFLDELRSLLSSSGTIIASIPNVRHWSVLLPLALRGQFEYRKQGILDHTHLRFFTSKTIRSLFVEQGFRLEIIRPNLWGKKQKIANKVTLGIITEFFANQWLIKAQKC